MPADDEAAVGDTTSRDGRSAEVIAREIQAKRQEYAASRKMIRLRQLASEDWLAWEQQWKTVLDKGAPYPPEMWDSVIAVSAVEPEMPAGKVKETPQEARQPAALRDSPWRRGSLNTEGGISVPFSRLSSHVLRPKPHAGSLELALQARYLPVGAARPPGNHGPRVRRRRRRPARRTPGHRVPLDRGRPSAAARLPALRGLALLRLWGAEAPGAPPGQRRVVRRRPRPGRVPRLHGAGQGRREGPGQGRAGEVLPGPARPGLRGPPAPDAHPRRAWADQPAGTPPSRGCLRRTTTPTPR
ncbi:hypothetical protein G5V59_02495 [Nocardioides sp. W3-2-3]|uniref:hypothetical protein n=1 Tax=Nocardioides convexus TaxID=2712224 RepID=UPI0024181FC7|nr:hypothetical protein [Nocardioides convexus]NGZ99622.1 hypothetical protein [Nocardioides convexus]